MKVRINYTVDLTDEQAATLAKVASDLGYGYDNPPPRKLIKRLLRDQGESELYRDRNDDQHNDEESEDGDRS